ncbi:Alanine--tRNA ligase [Buchnera aphidicola (Cinara kochiana kochiana)]|uniref:Alanine--tRNA ligase n=1 Tax=Buchnera aphidicola (Cinara kochiana kochiana) TaxID=2518976 RepID=A0A451D5T7_9GAMM|nr:alanine--tRNA ligase [Buchnera aphidicola]VFP81172.1 Alanine--tRNA ligase [Buchnera aphidicola (Cinara kochiana kochiana)]
MKTDKIRTLFLQFFKEKNHNIIPSSSLIPKKDNTLLFTNAGMNQFKDIYLGYKKSSTSSFASAQYCIRTGGNHDDLKKVGYKPYHHTLFEMLGNFSFGEYFKETAITYAWEFLTDKKWLNIPKKKLWVTYYYRDIETKKIWLNIINIKPNHLITIYDKNNTEYNSDNFWRMGDSGPCGPCTEIFYDQRSYYKKIDIVKDYHQFKKYFVEIWNLVFMQFNQIKSNKLIDLPTPSIDTGMGLERISAVLQKVSSSYQTNNFTQLMQSIKKKLSIKKNNHISLRIITDHIRTSTCLIAENIVPGNEGRNYILRKIIRRALSHGYFIGLHKPFFYKLSKFVINSMKQINIDFNLHKKIDIINKILFYEEKQFHYILKIGLNKLQEEIKNHKICTKKIFYLYETFGLPIEITLDICKKNKISINLNKINKLIKLKTNKKNNNNVKIIKDNSYLTLITKKSIFDGYDTYIKKSKITQIIYNNKIVSHLSKKNIGILILNITPFYSESSGQIGDVGKIINNNGIFIVENTKKIGNFIVHIGQMERGILNLHDIVTAKINIKKRKKIQSNHTSTHLLHAALNKVLQSEIVQKGSYIDDKYLRFDFIYNHTITEQNIYELEKIINKKIQKNILINTIITPFNKAKTYNAVYLHSKKYKKIVRMICINNFSIELCNGTHHNTTGQIGCFKIISHKNIGNSTKRITAITGLHVINYINKKIKKENKIKRLFTNSQNNIYKSIKKSLNDIYNIKKENLQLINQNILQISKNLRSTAYTINNIHIIIEPLSNIKQKILRSISDNIKKKLKHVIIILISKNITVLQFLINITKKIIKDINALDIMKILFSTLSGQGGGNKYLVEGKLNNNKFTSNNINTIKQKIINKIKNNIKKNNVVI